MAATAEALGTTVSPERIAIYAEDLAEIPNEMLGECFRRARKQSEFFPTVRLLLAEFRCLDEEVNGEKRRLDAWWMRAIEQSIRWGDIYWPQAKEFYRECWAEIPEAGKAMLRKATAKSAGVGL